MLKVKVLLLLYWLGGPFLTIWSAIGFTSTGSLLATVRLKMSAIGFPKESWALTWML